MRFNSFSDAILTARDMFPKQSIHTQKWQSTDVSKNPAARMHEILFYQFKVLMLTENLDAYRIDIKPDLPWADDHFLERISGEPLNPPPSEAWWPHAPQGNNEFKDGELFSHTYPERYWPKKAGSGKSQKYRMTPLRGIRYFYGDLQDVIDLLVIEPDTRQAYLPVWFPEDTGNVNDVRLPCSIGYWFIRREDKLHCHYFIRSCDYVRHFRNDIYMTIRLILWILDKLKSINPTKWQNVMPGTFVMDMGSLHIFEQDWLELKK